MMSRPVINERWGILRIE